MTTEEFWGSWLAFWVVAAGPILLAVLTQAYGLYLRHRYWETIKEALKNSRYIYSWGQTLGKWDFLWSIFEVSKLSGMMLWPKASILTGELDPVDFENFPPHLKRRLIINFKLMIVSFMWMLIGVALIQLR